MKIIVCFGFGFNKFWEEGGGASEFKLSFTLTYRCC